MGKRRWLNRGIGAFALVFLLVFPTYVFGSSFRGEGLIIQANPADGRGLDKGRCYLFLGPHGDFLGENEYLLQLGDEDLNDGFDAEIMGKFTIDERGRIRSTADDEEIEKFFQGFVDKQIGRDELDVKVRNVNVRVRQNRRLGEEVIRCRITIRADLIDGNAVVDRITLRYSGAGLYFEDFHGTFQDDGAALNAFSSSPAVLSQSSSLPAAAQASCPIPKLVPPATNPNTGKPIPNFCEPKSCLVNFAGFQWWTNYQWSLANGFFNGGLGTAFNPGFASVEAEGLHLKIGKKDLGGGKNWAGSEVVAMFHSDGTPARLGFGTYLVSAKVIGKTAATWDQLDPNIAFGVFTFQKDTTGGSNNPYRELDLAEISRFGRTGDTTNAQFAIQKWDARKDNVLRYTIDPAVNEVTLVMEWKGKQQPATFKQYNGRFDLDNLPASPHKEWTTSSEQNPYIPNSNCQRFHLNFWLGNFPNHPGPSNNQDQEIVVTNFQYRPLN